MAASFTGRRSMTEMLDWGMETADGVHGLWPQKLKRIFHVHHTTIKLSLKMFLKTQLLLVFAAVGHVVQFGFGSPTVAGMVFVA